MSHPHVLILTGDDDPHADRVGDLLTERGARVTVFNPGDFPVSARVDLTYAAGGPIRRTLRTGKRDIDLDAVTALWWRRPTRPAPHPEILDPAVAAHVARECESLVTDLWESLPCPHLPARESVFRRAGHKASQLAHAAELGFPIPETVITTDAESFLDFHDRHDGLVITKPLYVPWIEDVAGEVTLNRFCEPVSARDLAHAQGLRFCPVIVQERVPKRVELRVTIVGRRIFAAEIHSQVSNRSSLDWRRYDTKVTPYRPHHLSGEVAARCLALMDRLGLRYGAIDLILTPDGRHVFLEINPNAQWLWVQNLTGLPISEAIRDFLLEGA
ncbi:MvdC/MvdD family ATP grasp protein [Sphaerisporangium viridialbum]|uniref:MvdC/MvdD family ATP grasp protein n=1 Tax=Sphaerisporangium viridialbum TaxID=46189 RepID=UPI003C780CA5